MVSSGYTNDPVMQDFARFGFSGRLTEPYRINDMKTMLEEMIPQALSIFFRPPSCAGTITIPTYIPFPETPEM